MSDSDDEPLSKKKPQDTSSSESDSDSDDDVPLKPRGRPPGKKASAKGSTKGKGKASTKKTPAKKSTAKKAPAKKTATAKKTTTKKETEGKTKKVYNIPGQKKDTPEELDVLRMFYESAYLENGLNEMAVRWCCTHGLLPYAQAEALTEKGWDAYKKVYFKSDQYKQSQEKEQKQRQEQKSGALPATAVAAGPALVKRKNLESSDSEDDDKPLVSKKSKNLEPMSEPPKVTTTETVKVEVAMIKAEPGIASSAAVVTTSTTTTTTTSASNSNISMKDED